MREALDNVLQIIGATFLTTAEWNTASGVLNGAVDNVSQYRALRTVLIARGGEDDALERLKHYFLALGLSPADLDLPAPAFSNIFIGRSL